MLILITQRHPPSGKRKFPKPDLWVYGQNVVQLQLPSGTRRFTFTFESDEPGPVTLEVSIRPSLKWPVLAPLPAPDDSETEPESEPEDTTKVQPVFNTCIKPMGVTGVSLKDLKDNIYRNQIIIVNYYMSLSSHYKRVGECIVPTAIQDAGPVPRGFAIPLHELQPPLSLDVTFQDPCRISESPVEQEMLDYDFLTGEDLDLMTHGTDLPNLGLNFHSPEALHDAIEKAVEELQCEENQLLQEAEDNLDHLDIDIDACFDDPDKEEDMETATTNDIDEDDPDPFIPDEGFSATNDWNLTDVPPHLLTIYVVVSWLHLQFHLPHVACNALLMIFACILIALAPTIDVPFITLQSSNRVLGVDTTIFTLPVCPTCRDVFPPAMLTKSHDTYKNCGVDIFLPGMTQWGNLCTVKMPIIKYPYLPLSEQIKSLLKIPGLEAVLDGWCSKPRTIGKYTDIFDGDTCRTKLKGPDGKLFFSNLPHEQHGPDGELCIGVNLGANWFLYIRSNIAPSHSLAPTSFSICNLPPEYRVGIKIPTESCPQVICDKLAAHKLGGFTSHFHTNFCTLFGHGQMKNSKNLNFVKKHATRYAQLSHLPYFNLVEQIVIDPMHNLYLGLVKTHFCNIWVQGKILRANHELNVFHDMLADVRLDLTCSCGKLPMDIGMPSGGSLTADQWLLLTTVYGPIIIPQLWSSCLLTDMDNEILRQCVTMIKKAEADKEADAKSKAEQKATLAAAKKQGKEALKAEKAWIAHEKLALIAAEKKAKAAAKKASKKCQATSQIVEDLPEGQVWPPPPPPPPPPPLCLLPTSELLTEPAADAAGEEEAKFLLHPGDPANFLKLCAALHILSKCSLCDQDLYGSGLVKPDHHFVTHVGACVRNFGPLHDFWTFLFEHLNKLLKSYKTNNHSNGALEMTFFMEFHRTCELR
ncbi:hypothetical protein BDR06DRAFT_967985 [Suillus hirtellus]|nr:hypothetical protein BDR06DRAFT_967985 [Suillus hirtellus]